MEVHTLFRTILFPNLKVKDITGEKISRGCVGPGEVIVPQWSERWSPGREVWVRDLSGSLCSVLRQYILLSPWSPCLSPPRSLDGYRRIVRTA